MHNTLQRQEQQMKPLVMFLHTYTAAMKVPCCGVDEPPAEEVPVARNTAAEGPVRGGGGRQVEVL